MEIIFGKDFELLRKANIPADLQEKIDLLPKEPNDAAIVVERGKPYFNAVFNLVNREVEMERRKRKEIEKRIKKGM